MARGIQIAIWVVLGVALATSMVTDLRARKILNIVTIPTILLCLLLRFAGGLKAGAVMGPLWNGGGLSSGLLGMAIGAIVFYVMHVTGGMAMGDVKLAAAVGAAVGFPAIFACMLYISVVGGIEAIVVLIWKGKLLKTFGNMARVGLEKLKLAKPGAPLEMSKIPYGVAIAIGSVWGIVWWHLSDLSPM
ncbi:MAG TPA: prepilin peptidase [Myxococcales bacterium]